MDNIIRPLGAAVLRSTNLFLDGGLLVAKDIANFDLPALKDKIVNFDIRVLDAEAIIIMMLLCIGIGILTLVIFAQLTSEDNTPVVSKFNAALGLNSGVVHKPGDPPIPPPTEIVSLRIYPIKSCRGMEVDATRLRKTGLTLDRNWMFIDKAERKFLTIRSDPSMTLIDTAIVDKDKEQYLEISIHGTDGCVTIPAFPSQQWLEANTTLQEAEIWEEMTDAWEYGADVNKIFCKFFDKEVALVYKGPSPRNVAVNGKPELYGRKQNHHFADVMSCLVASEASLKDLNKQLEEDGHDPLTIERFRPNIIVKGRDDHPWEEDTWKRIRITTAVPAAEAIYKLDLDCVARCARCQVPNVNPDTAEKHKTQPWDKLMKFRRVDQGGAAKYKPCFGMLSIPKNEGIIKVGSTLEVLETTTKHLYNTASFSEL
ncbi:hypothetical protein AMS68_000335 [Peltaster fructicola]|uniref:MOSC domain-containing protein n=1 Tax=Peltaster fructicola TaxID=286661 RepID=A0A6H0XJK7_9PEZI|nr:hypothetical protein AMS68_000335 [Peltaster fructicola]